jgi:hypothetical protein
VSRLLSSADTPDVSHLSDISSKLSRNDYLLEADSQTDHGVLAVSFLLIRSTELQIFHPTLFKLQS